MGTRRNRARASAAMAASALRCGRRWETAGPPWAFCHANRGMPSIVPRVLLVCCSCVPRVLLVCSCKESVPGNSSGDSAHRNGTLPPYKVSLPASVRGSRLRAHILQGLVWYAQEQGRRLRNEQRTLSRPPFYSFRERGPFPLTSGEIDRNPRSGGIGPKSDSGKAADGR